MLVSLQAAARIEGELEKVTDKWVFFHLLPSSVFTVALYQKALHLTPQTLLRQHTQGCEHAPDLVCASCITITLDSQTPVVIFEKPITLFSNIKGCNR